MGIATPAARFLLRESRRRKFTGRVLSLGRQDIGFSLGTLRRIARDTGVALAEVDEERSRKPDLAGMGYLSDECFFRSLGFAESQAMDVSAYEGADHVFDLNAPECPEQLRERFDVIVDGGTMEHVFHTPNFLRNVFHMLKPGGRVIHMVPSSNHTDHGFYMFSPTLLWDYYHANRFEVNALEFVRYNVLSPLAPWSFYRYEPGALQGAANGELGGGMYAVFNVATKTDKSTCTEIPVQGRPLYEGDLRSPEPEAKAEEPAGMPGWKLWLARNAVLGPVAFRLQGLLRRLARVRLWLRPVALQRVDRY